MKLTAKITTIILFVSIGVVGQPVFDNTKKADSVKLLIRDAVTPQEIIDLTNIMVKKFYRSLPDSGLYYSRRMLEMSRKESYDFGVVSSLSNIAVASAKKGEVEEGLKISRNALAMADSIMNERAKKNALFAICEIFYTTRQIDSLLKYEQQSLILSEKLDDDPDLLVAYNNIAIDYSMKGYYELGLKYFLEASKINDKLPSDTKRNFQLTVNLGDLYTLLGDHDKTLFYHSKLYELAKSVDINSEIFAEGLLGQAYRLKGDYNESLTYLDRALKRLQENEIDNKELTSLIYYNKGVINEKFGENEEAIANYKRSIEWEQNRFGEGYYSEKHMTLANLYINLDKFKEAEKVISTAYINASGDISHMRDIFQTKAKYDSALNNMTGYINNYRKYVELKDSIQSYETATAVAQMQIEYETDLKSKEISILQNENEIKTAKQEKLSQFKNALIIGSVLLLALLILLYSRYHLKIKSLKTINRQKEAIEKKIDENDKLVQEMHHRVKNNLQIIISLLNAQTNLLKEDNRAIDIIQESQNRIKSLSLIHEDLFKSNNIDHVNARGYFETLAMNIQDSFSSNTKKVDIVTDIEDVSLKMGLAVPLGLILNELITNSFKYAFEGKDGGTIKISFCRASDSSNYTFEVVDDGVGVPPHRSSTPNSFGLQLVKGLTEQMLGELEIKNEQGTKVNIHIKVEELEKVA